MKIAPVARPARAIFREDAARATLALDPGGAGIIAGVRRGAQPQPGAFGMFDCPPALSFEPEEVVDGIAILAVSGPLEHHQHWLWTSYESLVAQMERAMTHESVRAIVLKIDSPGGVAAGMGEAHKAIRAMSKRYGIPVFAYADEMACSAAYHLASACSEVWTSEAGVVGSVGVILCTIDESEALKKQGVAVRYVVTGARKADMHPGNPVTDDVIDVAQAKVDYLGGLFFAAVGKARGMKPAAVEALQAAVFHGPGAVAAGLADGVAGWDEFLSYVKGAIGATAKANKLTDQSVSGAKARMATLLQAQATLTAARGALKAATRALDAAPADSKIRRAWADALTAKDAAKAAVNVASGGAPAAKMNRVTKTSKHVVTEESDEEEESASESMSSSGSSSAGSSSMSSSSEEEEEAAASTAKSSMPPKGESEEEEEAHAKAWAAAEHAYAKAARAFDPYGVRGPKGLRKLAAKATGQKGVDAMLGALVALPRKHAADATVAAKVERLETNDRKARVDAIVTEAKIKSIAGATTKAGRESLREMGLTQGTKFLKGHLATLPKMGRTTEDGALRTKLREGGGADPTGGGNAATAIVEQMTAGMNPKEKAEFIVAFNATIAAQASAAAPRS